MSLFMSVQNGDHSFFGCCQLGHISLLCEQESRTEAFTVEFLSPQTVSGPQTGHRVGSMLQELELTLED